MTLQPHRGLHRRAASCTRDRRAATYFHDYRQYGYLAGPDEVRHPGLAAASKSKSTPSAASSRTAGASSTRSPLNAGRPLRRAAALRRRRQDWPWRCPTSGLRASASSRTSPSRAARSSSPTSPATTRASRSTWWTARSRASPACSSAHARRHAVRSGCDPAQQQARLPRTCRDAAATRRTRWTPNRLWSTVSGAGDSHGRSGHPAPVHGRVRGRRRVRVIANARVGVIYTQRYMNHVIEDMSRDDGQTYFIGNPGYGIAKDFPKATRDYDARHALLHKTFADPGWRRSSYTWSRLLRELRRPVPPGDRPARPEHQLGLRSASRCCRTAWACCRRTARTRSRLFGAQGVRHHRPS